MNVLLSSAGPPYLLYFCVKFYAADPCRLHEELTRLVKGKFRQTLAGKLFCLNETYNLLMIVITSHQSHVLHSSRVHVDGRY